MISLISLFTAVTISLPENFDPKATSEIIRGNKFQELMPAIFTVISAVLTIYGFLKLFMKSRSEAKNENFEVYEKTSVTVYPVNPVKPATTEFKDKLLQCIYLITDHNTMSKFILEERFRELKLKEITDRNKYYEVFGETIMEAGMGSFNEDFEAPFIEIIDNMGRLLDHYGLSEDSILNSMNLDIDVLFGDEAVDILGEYLPDHLSILYLDRDRLYFTIGRKEDMKKAEEILNSL